jgi:hypothetical protein
MRSPAITADRRPRRDLPERDGLARAASTVNGG